jgi:hypothetical protein
MNISESTFMITENHHVKFQNCYDTSPFFFPVNQGKTPITDHTLAGLRLVNLLRSALSTEKYTHVKFQEVTKLQLSKA